MASRKAVVKWLLDSDPSIRWQVLRDLTDEPEEIIAAERSRVAQEGWGAKLLGLQTEDGDWGDDRQHGWMTTNDALALLRDLGADSTSEKVRKAIGLVQDRIRWWQLDGRPFFDGETEACINGRILGSGAYFGADVDRLLERLLHEQLKDGGWNCLAPPSTRSSFHSTICVLEGLLEYENANGPRPGITAARLRAEEYLLERRLLRSRSTGKIIRSEWTQISFPTRWHYDILWGLDYMRRARVAPDHRMAEAIDLVAGKRDAIGRWPLENPHPGPVYFDLEGGAGEPSRWNTLRALRVMRWARTD